MGENKKHIMTLNRLIFLLVCGSLHIYVVESQVGQCTDASWCGPQLAQLCSTPQFQTELFLNCPLLCNQCSKTEDDPLCQIDNGGCEQICSVENDVVKCGCPSGFQLDPNGQTCSDIDECKDNSTIRCPAFHQPFCINRRGTYFCSSQSCSTGSNGQRTGLINKYQSDECCRVEEGNPSCGQDSLLGRRIVGGTNAVFGGWPWMVYVLINDRILCGGSLIDPSWVLTAGHCFRGIADEPNTRIQTFFGRINPSATRQQEPNVQERRVIQWVLHEDWEEANFPYHDVALMKLDSPVDINNNIYPICLPNGQVPEPGTTCFITGFGTTAFRGSAAKQLQEVNVPIVTDTACADVYADSQFPINPPLQICAGHAQGGKDSCQGDSGGPLVCQRCETCSWYQAGVTSFGRGCARAGVFGVYADVEFHEEWISSVTGVPVNKNRKCGGDGLPTWSVWTLWGDCSRSCASGTQERSRTCINGLAGSAGCLGDTRETKDCNLLTPCPVWGLYGQWSPCSKSCGSGSRERTRECMNGNVGDLGCRGESSMQDNNCNSKRCPSWAPWVPWADCSLTCGDGERTSTRRCRFGERGDVGCQGDVTRTEMCKIRDCPGYTQWTSWSACSLTCGSGEESSTRTCNGGTASVSPGCQGRSSRTRPCATQICPVWGSWGKFEPCPVTCGRGRKVRTRRCINGNPGDDGCIGQESMAINCNTQDCPIWDQWSTWGICTRTCGGGSRTSERTCLNGVRGDVGCQGRNQRTEVCNTQECPFWSDYGEWSECSSSCGGGTRNRERNCVNGEVGDDGCMGPTTEIEMCNGHNCPALTEWGEYEDCSASCGEATRTRTRTCQYTNNPSDCNAELTDTQNCNLEICPGLWTAWTDYGGCSVPCGNGVRTRSRNCVGGMVGALGCEGSDTDTENCGEPCMTKWSDYGDWSQCTRTCYGGLRTRTRTCIEGNIGDPGCSPPEDAEEQEVCNEEICEEDSGCTPDDPRCGIFVQNFGAFAVCVSRIQCDIVCGRCAFVPPGEWTAWSECSKTCGKGRQGRTRVCNSDTCVNRQRQSCQGDPCNGFTPWSEWTSCPVTCGGGTQSRFRECPADRVCTPDSYGTALVQTQECETQVCPGSWDQWGSYSACSTTCGPGIITRTRSCIGGVAGETGCIGPVEETDNCNIQACPGAWGNWASSEGCSQTCGLGIIRERRECIGGEVGGEGCEGDDEQMFACNEGECVVEWSEWTAYSDCSASCEGGTQSRDRSCLNGNPGDVGCIGLVTESQNCNEETCDQDPCAGLADNPSLLSSGQSCEGIVSLCFSFSSFAVPRCARTCCEATQQQTNCEDNPNEIGRCFVFRNQCHRSIPFFTTNCRKTCNFC